MERSLKKDSPIVVGAVGGSGTRVVADILIGLGIFLGRNLDSARDNPMFIALFMRPKWWSRTMNEAGHHGVRRGLEIFTDSTFGQPPRSFRDIAFVMRAFLDLDGSNNPKRFISLMTRSDASLDPRFVGWGWKDPISHLYLEPLEAHYQGLKYIHLVRHGLDMAFSKNQNQLRRFGRYMGVSVPSDPELLPRASLRYWATVNNLARETCLALGPTKAIQVRFEDLCSSPRHEIRRIIDFIGVDVDRRLESQLALIPQMPSSSGRFKNESLSLFREEDVELVRSFGFDVDGVR